MLLPHNIVWATIETTDNDLIFTFLRQTMTETTFKTHFSEGFFRIEKAFVWANRDILAGMYPLQLIDNELILKIPPLSAFCAITLCVTVFPGFEGVQNTKFLTNKTLK